jgi:hypothetical protein
MVEIVGQWIGRRFPTPTGRTGTIVAIFKTIVAAYLGISAAMLIRDFTGIPVFMVLIAWYVLVSKFAFDETPANSILGDKHSEVLNYALLMLGTAYRVAGHASLFVLAVIVGYWALIVLTTKRRAG